LKATSVLVLKKASFGGLVAAEDRSDRAAPVKRRFFEVCRRHVASSQ
jgi:hypothetical protein